MMNSMKKIISIILACTMVLSMFVIAQAEETVATTQSAKYAKEIEIIKAMGIINGDETGAFNADANLTRAEFAQVLTVLLQINYSEVAQENAWYYTFKIPEDLDNVLLTPNSGLVTGNQAEAAAPAEEEKVQKFTDVDESHWAYEVVNQITDRGYMVGTSATEFSPEESVTVNQVNKVLVKILGYEQFANLNGGYPAGYNYVASTLKMLKGINNYGENPVTRGELAKLIYNMFDVNLIKATSVTDAGVANYQTSDKTFLNDILNVYKYEGKVTDNGTTAIFGSSTVENGEIKIGNVVFGLSDKADYVKGFIGRYVEFYAVKDEDTGKEVVLYASLAKDSQEFTIEIDDFEALGNGKLKYLDENEKVDYIDIAYVPTIIFNGSKVESITDEQIKAFSNGTVTAMKSGESKNYDTIIIEGFVSMYVKTAVASEKMIANALVEPGENSDYINLDLKEENNKNREITIIKDGLNASFADIKAGTVIDVAKSADAIKVVISDRKEKIKITSKSIDEYGDSYIYSEENAAFLLADELVNSNCVAVPDLGVEATAYFNTFGEIVYFDASVASLSNLAIVLKAVAEGRGLKKEYKVRLFTDLGAFVDYPIAEKVAFTNENDVYRKIEVDEEFVEMLNTYKDKLITYATNDEGFVSEIILPAAVENSDTRASGRFGILYSASGGVHYAQSSFEGIAFTKNTPKLFYISPDDTAEEKARYQIKTSSVLANDTDVSSIVAYNKDPKSFNATHIVIYDSRYTNHSSNTRTTTLFIVTSVKHALSIDGDPAVKVEGYELPNQNANPTFKSYESSTGAFSNMIPFVGNNAEDVPTYSVQVGDIINVFESNGNVEYASIFYRQSANYAKNPRKQGGALMGQENGLYDASGKGNPYTISSGGKTIETNGFKISTNTASGTNATKLSGDVKVWDAYALSINEGLISFTNMDLSNSENVYKKTDDTQATFVCAVPSYILVMDVKGSKITTRVGSVRDIKTYDTYGSACSRLIINHRQGSVYKLIVINVED